MSATPGAGFRIYNPLAANPHQAPSAFFGTSTAGGIGSEAPVFQADFSAYQLLRVMNRLAQPQTRALPYFLLCREMGVRAIDGMVKGRILDLRWTEPVSREFADPYYARMSARVRESIRVQLGGAAARARSGMGAEAGSSGTAVDEQGVQSGAGAEEGSTRPRTMLRPVTEYEEMEPMTDEEVLRAHERLAGEVGMDEEMEDEEEEVLGPKLVPISPIMRYAMMEVVQEYYADEDRTESEYASLSDADIQEY